MSDGTIALEAFAGVYYDAFGVPQHLRDVDAQTGFPMFFFLVGVLGTVTADTGKPNPLVVGQPKAEGGHLDGEALSLYGPDGRPGWADAVDVDHVPPFWVPWLAQFVGVRIPGNTSAADALAMVRAREGWERGTPAHMIRTAQRYLRDGSPVFLTERDGGAYRLTVRLYRHDLAAPTYAELNVSGGSYDNLTDDFPTYADLGSGAEDVDRALQTAKPGGLILNVLDIVGGISYGDLTDDFPTYTDFADEFPTYWDAIDAEP